MSKIKRTYTITHENISRISFLQESLFKKHGVNYSQSDVVNYAIAHLPDFINMESKLKHFSAELVRLRIKERNRMIIKKMDLQDVISNFDELKKQGKVRNFDFYKDREDEEIAAFEDGFIWVEEVDSWIKTS